MDVYEVHIPGLRKRLEAATEAVDGAQRSLREHRSVERFLQTLVQHLEDGQPGTALLLLERERRNLRLAADAGAETADLFQALQASVEQAAAAIAADFERTFPAAAEAAGVPVDRTSRHPRYTFKDGFLTVELRPSPHRVVITPRDGGPITAAVDVTPAVERVRAELRRLFERPLDADALLRRIDAAYRAVIGGSGASDGEDVPIRAVANLLRERKGFRLDEFNVDLARLVTRPEPSDSRGRLLKLSQTKHTASGLLLHGLETGGYVGYVAFRNRTVADD
jgi:hypothetical protein